MRDARLVTPTRQRPASDTCGPVASGEPVQQHGDVRVMLACQRLQRHYGPSDTAGPVAPWDATGVRDLIASTEQWVNAAQTKVHPPHPGWGRTSPAPPAETSDALCTRCAPALQRAELRVQTAEQELHGIVHRDAELRALLERQSAELNDARRQAEAAERRAAAAEDGLEAAKEQLSSMQQHLLHAMDEVDKATERMRSMATDLESAQTREADAADRAEASMRAADVLRAEAESARAEAEARGQECERLRGEVRVAGSAAVILHESTAAQLDAAAAAQRESKENLARLERDISIAVAKVAERDATVAGLQQQLRSAEEQHARAIAAAAEEAGRQLEQQQQRATERLQREMSIAAAQAAEQAAAAAAPPRQLLPETTPLRLASLSPPRNRDAHFDEDADLSQRLRLLEAQLGISPAT
eukprot:TRINITY_DN40398_c0_g1_i1.p1 TRINITY_DN40398_c0_g1~~TRINITY_DN40398_c0_g1_i1.p1  ORF type:complete len:416 (+),score=186.97 TRINITY_DN40398_c0_g1_i1:65-1312(+)